MTLLAWSRGREAHCCVETTVEAWRKWISEVIPQMESYNDVSSSTKSWWTPILAWFRAQKTKQMLQMPTSSSVECGGGQTPLVFPLTSRSGMLAVLFCVNLCNDNRTRSDLHLSTPSIMSPALSEWSDSSKHWKTLQQVNSMPEAPSRRLLFFFPL